MKKTRFSILLATPLLLLSPTLRADHVILDDCIIDGSMCVGLDCVNGENFGFDTIRMKENNLRFHFDDTSVAAAFPRNDWRFIANDSANGGDSYLGIEDTSGGRIPFRVEAGAGSNSLFVESTGDVGFGTNNPVVRVHLSDGDTPTVRLEQNGSSGWNPQTWDVAGNETNFFVRDVTHGSKLPFRIRPDAPTSSIEIEADGNIDIGKSITLGTTEAGLRLTLPDAGNDLDYPAIQIGETFISSGAGFARFSNNNYHDGTSYSPNNKDRLGGVMLIDDQGRFRFFQSSAGAGVVPSFTELVRFDANGDVDSMTGVFGMLSDKNSKADIEEVDTASVLEKLAQLPIATWRYKHQEDTRHMGPMAQDFRAAYGLGKNDTTLTLGDSSAVALASAQELYKRLQDKEGRITDLEEQNDALQKRLERIEKALELPNIVE